MMADEPATNLEGRNPDGTFNEAWKGGPGRPKGTRLTWQSYADRVSHWQEKPFEEIEILINDPKLLKKYPSRDVLIIKQIYAASEKDIADEREKLLDREVGKSLQRQEVGGAENGTPIEVENTVTLKIDTA